MRIRMASYKDSLGIARVQVETWKSTYSGLISSQHVDSLSIPKSALYWETAISQDQGQRFVLVVEHEGALRGFLAGGPARDPVGKYSGEVYALYVESASQGKALGSALFQEGLKRLGQLRLNDVMVWVLKGNPYYRFYEKMGGIEIGEKEMKIGEATYLEIGYGWPERGFNERPRTTDGPSR